MRFQIEITIETSEPSVDAARAFVDDLPYEVSAATVYAVEHDGQSHVVADRKEFGTWETPPRFPPPVNPLGPRGKPARPRRSRARGNPRTWGQR
jgi:hypothetical protein